MGPISARERAEGEALGGGVADGLLLDITEGSIFGDSAFSADEKRKKERNNSLEKKKQCA